MVQPWLWTVFDPGLRSLARLCIVAARRGAVRRYEKRPRSRLSMRLCSVAIAAEENEVVELVAASHPEGALVVRAQRVVGAIRRVRTSGTWLHRGHGRQFCATRTVCTPRAQRVASSPPQAIMANSPRHPHTMPSAPQDAPPFRPKYALTLALITVVVLAAWVQRRPLLAFFGPDDLIHIEQALGILPPPHTLFRILSQFFYFGVMLSAFGPYPPAFHLVSLIVHLLNVLLLASVLRRSLVAPLITTLTVALFGLSPLIYTSLLYAVNINDILATAWLLVTIRLLQANTRLTSILSVGSYALSLFCKESTLLVPLVMPLFLQSRGTMRARLWTVLPHAMVMTLFAVGFLSLRPVGLAPGGSTYAMHFGVNVITNIMAYIAWSTDMVHCVPESRWPPSMWPALMTGVAWYTAVMTLRSVRGPLTIGVAWFAVGVAPVAVLAHQAYAHYLYMPLMGLATVIAGMFLGVWERVIGASVGVRRAVAGPWSGSAPGGMMLWLCAVTVVAYAIRADGLIGARSGALLTDPMTRKSVIAGSAVMSVAQQLRPGVDCIAIYLAPEEVRVFGARTGREYPHSLMSSGYDLLADVLDQGRALRVFFPALRQVRFVSTWSESLAECQMFARRDLGTLESKGTGPDGALAIAEEYLARGIPAAALRVARAYAATRPADPRGTLLVARARRAYETAAAPPPRTAAAPTQPDTLVRSLPRP